MPGFDTYLGNFWGAERMMDVDYTLLFDCEEVMDALVGGEFRKVNPFR